MTYLDHPERSHTLLFLGKPTIRQCLVEVRMLTKFQTRLYPPGLMLIDNINYIPGKRSLKKTATRFNPTWPSATYKLSRKQLGKALNTWNVIRT